MPRPFGGIVHVVRLGKNAAIRIHGNNLDAGNLLLQLQSSPSDSTACPSRHDHVVELAASLLEDLLSGPLIVGKGVCRILVLVKDVAIQVLRQPRRQEDVRVLSIPRCLSRCPQDLCAKGLHGVHLLPRHLLRKTNDHLVTLQRSSEAKPDASVAAGWLDEHITWLDPTTLLGLLDHALADAVLHGSTCIEKLALGHQLALDL
mmetsp:Transcript_5396/g.12361  ORF Transcript_5396/g.12361 Transcript_5396/m.12361 type:complete len:203 (-) Transcript_5396:266-874(-)